MRKELLQKDCMMSVEKCKEKASLIAAVAERSRWLRIWDSALECGGMIHQMCASPHKANESPWKREEAMSLL